MTDQLVKRFVAPTMTRALELVQRELGPEAVILSSRKVEKGIEIVTALEPDLPTRGIDVRRQFGQNFDSELDRALPSDSAWRAQAGIEKAAAEFGGRTEAHERLSKPPAELAREIEAAREKMYQAKRRAKEESEGYGSGRRDERDVVERRSQAERDRYAERSNYAGHHHSEAHTIGQHGGASSHNNYGQPYPDAQSRHYGEPTRFDETPREFAEAFQRAGSSAAAPGAADSLNPADRQRLETLQNDIADMRMLLEQQMWQMAERQRPAFSNLSLPQQVSMSQHYPVLSEHLARLGLSEPIVDQLVAQVNHGTRASEAWRECMAILAKQLPICQQNFLEKPGIYAFLGQTGVGKTTTIAKLAAQYVLKHGPGKVALVTTDTYRVGAFDQLRTMGRILNVPVKVVDRENSLLTVLASLRQFPLILIDTAGFRLGDPLLKAQLDQLEASASIKRVLVLACNSQMATMKASIHAHRGQRGLYACVFTKLDESASIGEAMSVVMNENLPVAYTTDGQDIPKDIAPASAHNLVAKAVSIAKGQYRPQSSAAV